MVLAKSAPSVSIIIAEEQSGRILLNRVERSIGDAEHADGLLNDIARLRLTVDFAVSGSVYDYVYCRDCYVQFRH
ncbi:hypothetical protein D3C75_1168980 [compost metagenome]